MLISLLISGAVIPMSRTQHQHICNSSITKRLQPLKNWPDPSLPLYHYLQHEYGRNRTTTANLISHFLLRWGNFMFNSLLKGFGHLPCCLSALPRRLFMPNRFPPAITWIFIPAGRSYLLWWRIRPKKMGFAIPGQPMYWNVRKGLKWLIDATKSYYFRLIKLALPATWQR